MKTEDQMERIVNPFVFNQVLTSGMVAPTTVPSLHETYAQCYEDVIICQMIKAYAVRKKLESFRLSYVEIGANHPVSTSSSYLISRTFGVNGVLVEPNPSLAAELRKHRPDDIVIEAAIVDDTDSGPVTLYIGDRHELSSLSSDHVDTLTGETKGKLQVSVPSVNINDVLENMNGIEHYVLTIDVEGMDYRILKSINFSRHRPTIIQIEPSEHFYPGTIHLMVDYLLEHSYTLVSFNFVNMIFMDSGLLP